jgi:hypothetical protein
MTITVRKITAFTDLISALADKPSSGFGTTALLKQWFDKSPEELRVSLNGLIDDLAATAAGVSGADNIGSAAISGVSGATVYAQLVSLKAVIDAATAVGAIITAQLADGAVNSAKILDGSIVDIDISATAAIAWTKISKSASSLLDLATRSASDLSSGTLNVARLPTAIPATSIGNGDVTNAMLSFINSLSSNAQTQLDAKVPLTQKGAANGVASLDSGAKVPISQLPDAVLGALEYQGAWNASTNTPTLTASPTTIKGYYYVVSVAGTQFSISFDVGDWIVSNGTVWQKIDNTDAVSSFNGRLGAILPVANDYTWTQINRAVSSFADIATRSASDINAGTLPVAQIPAGIPATSIGNADVTNTILSFLNTLTSNAQTQINNRAPLTHVGAGGTSQHPDATTSQSGFISVADLIAFRALQPTTGLSGYSVPVGQVFPWWSRYSQEQDPVTGEMVFYEI